MSNQIFYIDVNITATASLTISASDKNEAMDIAMRSISPLPEVRINTPLDGVCASDIVLTKAEVVDI